MNQTFVPTMETKTLHRTAISSIETNRQRARELVHLLQTADTQIPVCEREGAWEKITDWVMSPLNGGRNPRNFLLMATLSNLIAEALKEKKIE